MQEEVVQPAAWAQRTGPPPTRYFTAVTRALQCACVLLMAGWVFGHLGGLRLSPEPSADGSSNDTGALFNWHPLLISLAFPLLMGEAVLAYKAPLVPAEDRCGQAAGRAVLRCAATLHAWTASAGRRWCAGALPLPQRQSVARG